MIQGVEHLQTPFLPSNIQTTKNTWSIAWKLQGKKKHFHFFRSTQYNNNLVATLLVKEHNKT
jgi:hypothetical protein